MRKIIHLVLIFTCASLVQLGSGCATTKTVHWVKPGATELEFQGDLMLAEMRADVEINNAMAMPAQSGLEAMLRGAARPAMRKGLIEKNLKAMGWTKQK